MAIRSLKTGQFSRSAMVGNTPAAPTAPVAGYNLWLDAADATTFTFSSGTSVSQWTDKSANGYTFTEATASNQPSRSGTLNGKSTVVYDGTTDRLISTATASTWNYLHNGDKATVFIVCKINGTGTHYPFATCDDATSSIGFGFYGDSGTVFGAQSFRGVSGSVGPQASTTMNTTTFYVYSTYLDQDNAIVVDKTKLYQNSGFANVNSVNQNGSNSTCSRTLSIGMNGAVSGGGWMKGEIAEIISYTSLISNADRTKNVDYLKAKWGL